MTDLIAAIGLYPALVPRYREPLGVLSRLVKGERAPSLGVHLIAECELARAFDWSGDARRRAVDRAAIASAPSTAAAARRLATLLQTHPGRYRDALDRALAQAGLRLAPVSADGRRPDVRLHDLLQGFAAALDEPRQRFGGAYLHRSRIGPFLLPKHLDGAPDSPSPTTVLCAYLSGECRLAAAGRIPIRQAGEPLVTAGGTPLWDACGAFSVAALGSPEDDPGTVADAAKKWLRRNPGVQVVFWE